MVMVVVMVVVVVVIVVVVVVVVAVAVAAAAAAVVTLFPTVQIYIEKTFKHVQYNTASDHQRGYSSSTQY